MYIEEQYINRSENYMIGSNGLYKPFTDDPGRLYKSLVQEYGRCTGKVYIDLEGEDGQTIAIGWVFLKRVRYEDARSKKDTYLREVWVTLHDDKPTVTTKYHYHKLG